MDRHPQEPPTAADLAAAAQQLGRPVRGVVAIAHRCGCGQPDVLVTRPSLPDRTPFPTLYYLTCPRATGLVSTLESESVMRRMSEDLARDVGLAAAYRQAHESYLADRATLGDVPAIAGISAGGMPDRVKCLHVLVAHSLAVGPGVNPLGDQALDLLARRGADPATAWGGGPAGCLGSGTPGAVSDRSDTEPAERATPHAGGRDPGGGTGGSGPGWSDGAGTAGPDTAPPPAGGLSA